MREIFNSIDELAKHMRANPHTTKKKTPYRININGEVHYTLAGNSDQAIATVVRAEENVGVQAVSLGALMAVS